MDQPITKPLLKRHSICSIRLQTRKEELLYAQIPKIFSCFWRTVIHQTIPKITFKNFLKILIRGIKSIISSSLPMQLGTPGKKIPKSIPPYSEICLADIVELCLMFLGAPAVLHSRKPWENIMCIWLLELILTHLSGHNPMRMLLDLAEWSLFPCLSTIQRKMCREWGLSWEL